MFGIKPKVELSMVRLLSKVIFTVQNKKYLNGIIWKKAHNSGTEDSGVEIPIQNVVRYVAATFSYKSTVDNKSTFCQNCNNRHTFIAYGICSFYRVNKK